MQLDDFLHNLHFDLDKVRPIDTIVDWEDAPLPFKLYPNLPTVALPSETSVSRGSIQPQTHERPGLNEISDILWYSYGLTQLCHAVFPSAEGEQDWRVMQMLRRFAPSGGGLYPSELYAYLKIDGIGSGIYHYDVAHHSLVLLREGNFDEYVERALGHRCNLSSCFGALFVSTMFWKNFYKYNHFSYRLQGLDAGVLIGQVLETAKQSSYSASVHFQFLDRALNHLLGLREQEETVYAVIPLSLKKGDKLSIDPSKIPDGAEFAEVLCKELPSVDHRHYIKSKTVSEYPLITKMNETSMLDSTALFSRMSCCQFGAELFRGEMILLPKIDIRHYDFAAICRQRYSPGLEFVQHPVSLEDLSALLRETTGSFEYVNDLDSIQPGVESRVAIAECVHGVDGIEDGAYIYDAKVHGLRLLDNGDHRMRLQQGMSMPNVNLFQVPLCLHLVGSSDFYRTSFGFRGHRIQQMEVGIVLQRLLLAASSIGMAGHPLLGYDEAVCDDIYNLGQHGKTCLIQVPVGFYRKTSRFEGTLHG